MRIFEITEENKFAALLYDIDLNTDKNFDIISKLFDDIMVRNLSNYAFMSLSFFNSIKTHLILLLDQKDIFPDPTDPDLIKLLSKSKLISANWATKILLFVTSLISIFCL